MDNLLWALSLSGSILASGIGLGAIATVLTENIDRKIKLIVFPGAVILLIAGLAGIWRAVQLGIPGG